MDPASALGVAASVVGIVDIISRSLIALHDIHKRLQEASFTLSALIGELETARAALRQLQALIEELWDDTQHYQLTLDLGCSLAYCHLLVSFIDEKISKLEWAEGSNTATFRSRVKVVLDDKETTNCLERLSRSMVSINLNIDAYRCRSPERQRELLNEKKRRRVFDQIKDDTSSLIVLCDSASASSARTYTTTATSRLSFRLPGIDEQLLRTDAYKKLFSGLVQRAKERTKRGPASSSFSAAQTVATSEAEDKDAIAAKKAQENSEQIDRVIEEDYKIMRTEVKILVLGDQVHAAEAVKRMKDVVHGGHTDEERKAYLPQILEVTMASMQILLDAIIEQEEKWLDQEHAPFVRILRDALSKPQESQITEDVVSAIQSLLSAWKETENYSSIVAPECTLRRETQTYFLDQLQRISEPGYIPSEEDIERLPPDRLPPIVETKFDFGFTVKFIQVHQSRSKKWISSYELVMAIFFVVDMTCYNQINFEEDPASTKLEDLFRQFDSIVNSRWFTRKDVILLLQYDPLEFQAQLEVDPLTNYFPDFDENNDVSSAAKYIQSRFEHINGARPALFCNIAKANDSTIARFVSSSLRKCIVQNALDYSASS